MIRSHVTFQCLGAQLVGTLDGDSRATSGVLIVTGGNEVRAGAWNGQAIIAARLAALGHAVFRFDRRGIGDSEGENHEFLASAPDIEAALAAFRELCPDLGWIVGLGNCDAASALMLCGGASCDALMLSNPWTFEASGEENTPDQVRDHYRRRLANPAAIKRLLTGQVSMLKLARSLLAAAKPSPAVSHGSLLDDLRAGLASYRGTVVLAIAARDRTGTAFVQRWDKADPRITICAGATHSFAEPASLDWYCGKVLELLGSRPPAGS